MNYSGFVILVIPILGLFAICRGGKWNWKVVQQNKFLNGVFWYGWFGSLLAGLLALFDVV